MPSAVTSSSVPPDVEMTTWWPRYSMLDGAPVVPGDEVADERSEAAQDPSTEIGPEKAARGGSVVAAAAGGAVAASATIELSASAQATTTEETLGAVICCGMANAPVGPRAALQPPAPWFTAKTKATNQEAKTEGPPEVPRTRPGGLTRT